MKKFHSLIREKSFIFAPTKLVPDGDSLDLPVFSLEVLVLKADLGFDTALHYNNGNENRRGDIRSHMQPL